MTDPFMKTVIEHISEEADRSQKVGLRVINAAREAVDDLDGSTSVSVPGESTPGEFYAEVDGVNVIVRVEIL